ncbi:MAG: hypothetical protein IPN17_08860 [Deltaproteobacteria bacterium]|nr:hypothetical protein [Deltaproteobacteria bacterium]
MSRATLGSGFGSQPGAQRRSLRPALTRCIDSGLVTQVPERRRARRIRVWAMVLRRSVICGGVRRPERPDANQLPSAWMTSSLDQAVPGGGVLPGPGKGWLESSKSGTTRRRSTGDCSTGEGTTGWGRPGPRSVGSLIIGGAPYPCAGPCSIPMRGLPGTEGCCCAWARSLRPRASAAAMTAVCSAPGRDAGAGAPRVAAQKGQARSEERTWR